MSGTKEIIKNPNPGNKPTPPPAPPKKGTGMKYKVWECKIVVPADAELPSGFDSPPRTAASTAVTDSGIEVVGCLSGWGGTLTKEEEAVIDQGPYG